MENLDLPGFPKEDVDIKIRDNALTITAQKKTLNEESTDKYHKRERSFGSFQRSILLPVNADQESINATFNHGVLLVKIPKRRGVSAEKYITVE